jgi:hypothetical protein
MRGRYFRDMTIVRVGGDSTAPAPEANEVVIYRSFLKAGLRFPLSRFLVEVLKIFQIFLHQLMPKAIIRMGLFVWVVRSQGLEPRQKVFAACTNFYTRRRPPGRSSIATTSVVMDSLLDPMQAIQFPHSERDGLDPGWKSGFMLRMI